MFPCCPVPPFPCFLVSLSSCSPVTLFPRYRVSQWICGIVPLFISESKIFHSDEETPWLSKWPWYLHLVSFRTLNIYFSFPVLSLLNINDGQARGRCPSLRYRCSLLWPFRDRERQKRRLGTTQLPLPRKLQRKGWGKTKKKLFESRGPRET